MIIVVATAVLTVSSLTIFFYLLEKSYNSTMQNFLYSILHYTFNVAMIMENGTITLISNRFLCFTFLQLLVACVFRRVLHRFTRVKIDQKRERCVCEQFVREELTIQTMSIWLCNTSQQIMIIESKIVTVFKFVLRNNNDLVMSKFKNIEYYN